MAERKTTDMNTGTAPQDNMAGADQVQEQVDEENAQGFRGYNPDPTPNEHYTFGGQAAGKPTPETDPHMAALTGKAVHQHAGHALREHLKKTEKK